MKTDGTHHGSTQGGIGHNSGDTPNSSPIKEIAGGAMFLITEMTVLAYIAMRQVAVNGTFYMTARQLAEVIWCVRPDLCRGGKPPRRETIYRIWKKLSDRGLIRKRGYLPNSGVVRWEMCDEAALECYARFSEAWHEVRRGKDNVVPFVQKQVMG